MYKRIIRFYIIYKLKRILKEHYNYNDSVNTFYISDNNSVIIPINCDEKINSYTIQTYKFTNLISYLMKGYDIDFYYSYENLVIPENYKKIEL